MDEKIKLFFDEASKGHCILELYEELLEKGSSLVDYAVKNNRLNDLKFLITPQKYDDGIVRILYDPFSDEVYSQLNIYLYQETIGIKELIDSLYDIDYEMLFQIKVKDSHARQISGMGHSITGEKDIIYYSEPACLKSMLKLYELNIDTWANDTDGCIEDGKNFNNKCGINIYYSRLNEENRKIVDKFIQDGLADLRDRDDSIVFLNVKCDREETVGQVSDKLLSVISQLKIQDVKSYPLNDQTIRNLAIELYRFKYRYKQLSYELLSEELIKYYQQFSLEDFPDKEEAIQNVKNNVYDVDALNDYFQREEDFNKQVVCNIVSSIPLEKCIQELKLVGYYIDEENSRIYDNKMQYLRHLKYLGSRQSENNVNNVYAVSDGDGPNFSGSGKSRK